jgi:tRNA(fMet)-specific endonuclease VapC
MLSRMQILSFSEGAIERFEELSRMKLGVKANDLRIAAIAVEHSAIIVTRNRVDFGRIPGLTIEDWSI